MLAIALLLCLIAPSSAAAEPPKPSIQGGFASERELIDAFLVALRDADEDALRDLMFTREEYRDRIIPGSVPPGQPWRDWPERVRTYQTDEFYAKNLFYLQVLIERFGGRKLTIKDTRFTEGTRRYDAYSARGELRIAVDMETKEIESTVIRLGWIGEGDGRYKFLGFRADRD